MPEAAVQEYIDTPEARARLADFLEATGPLPAGISWHRRLAHWWDENPHAALDATRGYISCHAGRLTAFAGAIPQAYHLDGRTVPVLLGTTFRVQPGHSRAGLGILIHMRDQGRRLPVVQTTPLPRLREVLQHMGARAETRLTRRLHPLGALARLHASGQHAWPALPPDLRLVTDLAHVRGLALPEQPLPGLHKAASLENLRWQLATPMHPLRLLGAVDASGLCHGFLLLRPTRVLRLLPAWEAVEAWSASPHPGLLHALAGCLARQPGLCGQARPWLATAAFPTDATWHESPALLQRQEAVCHSYLLPETLRHISLRPVLAEGDLLL